nr:type II toxin-antitoxin system RelE/ParE family toxin [Enterobacter asburiae]
MKEIELTPKAEEDLEAIWGYSFRQFGIVQADAYISRIAAVFNVLAIMTSARIALSWETISARCRWNST